MHFCYGNIKRQRKCLHFLEHIYTDSSETWLQRRTNHASVAYYIWNSHSCQLKKKKNEQSFRKDQSSADKNNVAGGCYH